MNDANLAKDGVSVCIEQFWWSTRRWTLVGFLWCTVKRGREVKTYERRMREREQKQQNGDQMRKSFV